MASAGKAGLTLLTIGVAGWFTGQAFTQETTPAVAIEQPLVEQALSTPTETAPEAVVAPTPTEVAEAPVEVQADVPAPTPPDVAATNGNVEFVEVAKPLPADIRSGVSTSGVELISVAVNNQKLEDVILMFTHLSGVNIIATPSNLQNTVSVNLTDVEWKPALESILAVHQLGLVEVSPGSGVYSIKPRPADAPEPQHTDVVRLHYVKTDDATKAIEKALGAGITISPVPSRNSLVLRGTLATLAEAKKIIEAVDRQRDQVYIEAKFMELDDRAIQNLGINWQVLEGYGIGIGSLTRTLSDNRTWDDSRTDGMTVTDNRNKSDIINRRQDLYNEFYEESKTTYEEQPPESGIYVPTTVITPTRSLNDELSRNVTAAKGQTDSYTKQVTDVRTAVLGADDFRLVLSALKDTRGVTVVSNPRIIVANEEEATIHIGDTQRPFISTVTPATDNSAPLVTYNPGDPVDLGVKLLVTPVVNTESNISVTIQPELTRLAGTDTAPNGQTYPIISKKRIRTLFSLESGKTAAIGGLTETTDNEAVKKIPLLGDLPLLGKYLFSHTTKEKRQQETIIFVTMGLAMPDVMQQDAGLPENSELVHKKVLNTELRRQEFKAEMEKAREAVEKAKTEPKTTPKRKGLFRSRG